MSRPYRKLNDIKQAQLATGIWQSINKANTSSLQVREMKIPEKNLTLSRENWGLQGYILFLSFWLKKDRLWALSDPPHRAPAI